MHSKDVLALVDEKLSLTGFQQLSGTLAGKPFVKVVVERETKRTHFLNHSKYTFHADYIAEQILGVDRAEVRKDIDNFNTKVYLSEDRPFYLGIITKHDSKDGDTFILETVEIDNLNQDMLLDFFQAVRQQIDQSYSLFFKPANHLQEATIHLIGHDVVPRIFNYELYSTKAFVPLNCGRTTGRLRLINETDYSALRPTLEWYDIIVMDKVPDNIPRISGIINAQHTTPLSHTNVLATGWQIPNAIQIGVKELIAKQDLNGQWVEYDVDTKADQVVLNRIEAPQSLPTQPAWRVQRIRLEEPETLNTPIVSLDKLRMSDKFRYGTKAANLGELCHIIEHNSGRLLGFYRVPRPPRDHLLKYIANYLQIDSSRNLEEGTWQFLRENLVIPRGIAIPFSVQQEFLESSPKIQQTIGKLKMALELDAKEIDALSLQLQHLIKQTRLNNKLRDYIDNQIATHLGGVSSFVIRSSSNAEDLKDFSAAGIYESINHVTSAENIFESIKEVWSSLVSPRSVRLRHEVGISLDDSYMGVIIQEEINMDIGGVLVTTNPLNPTQDFRNVYINASTNSTKDVVEGTTLPFQYLYNTVEGGGNTLTLGSAKEDLSEDKKQMMQRLAFAGRLLQSHFSQDYTFSTPVDIEWGSKQNKIFILQLRPYAI